MAYGKTIRIYLADGSASGIRHAEVVNWTGQALVCPRSRVSELKDWAETKRPGAYILIGTDDETGGVLAYIGEAENVLDRLFQHLQSKDFWNEAVLFTSKDENLTKSHVKYLESRMISLAQTANRHKLANGTAPQPPSLPRSDRDAMEEFIEHARTLLSALGHRLLEPVVVPQSKQQALPTQPGKPEGSDEALTYSVKSIVANGVPTDEGFVVFAGSKAAISETSGARPWVKELRLTLVTEGALKEVENALVFTKDVLFTSSSTAATVVAGSNRSGPDSWRTSSGVTLKQLEADASQSINLPKGQ